MANTSFKEIGASVAQRLKGSAEAEPQGALQQLHYELGQIDGMIALECSALEQFGDRALGEGAPRDSRVDPLPPTRYSGDVGALERAILMLRDRLVRLNLAVERLRLLA